MCPSVVHCNDQFTNVNTGTYFKKPQVTFSRMILYAFDHLTIYQLWGVPTFYHF